jgi:protein-disulfide isomerase
MQASFHKFSLDAIIKNMNTKRIIFWACFIIVLGLIIWGMVVAMNKVPADVSLGMAPAVTSADHVSSTSTVPVTVIEYSDFQCPACAAYFPIVEQLVSEASTTMRLVYRHFPLAQHKNSQLAARASEAAANQGKFWDMYHILFENQDSWATLSDSAAQTVFAGYAERLGLDAANYSADLDSDATKQKVSDSLKAAISLGVNSTPTFFVNGKVITNPPNYAEFKKLIETTATNSTP